MGERRKDEKKSGKGEVIGAFKEGREETVGK